MTLTTSTVVSEFTEKTRQSIESYFALQGVTPDDYRLVAPKLIEEGMAVGCNIQKGFCHNNAFNFLSSYLGYGERKYVTGYYVSKKIGIPLLHSWVKIDDHYYDPTVQQFGDLGEYYYLSFYELTTAELLDVVAFNGDRPPCAADCRCYYLNRERQNTLHAMGR